MEAKGARRWKLSSRGRKLHFRSRAFSGVRRAPRLVLSRPRLTDWEVVKRRPCSQQRRRTPLTISSLSTLFLRRSFFCGNHRPFFVLPDGTASNRPSALGSKWPGRDARLLFPSGGSPPICFAAHSLHFRLISRA